MLIKKLQAAKTTKGGNASWVVANPRMAKAIEAVLYNAKKRYIRAIGGAVRKFRRKVRG